MTEDLSTIFRQTECCLQETLTLRLYDLRIKAYPKMFELAGAFEGPKLDYPDLLTSILPEILGKVEDWHSRVGGLLLSESAYHAYEQFRDAIRHCIDTKGAQPDFDNAKHQLWLAKNEIRAQLRNDLKLLFTGDAAQTQTVPASP
jgi:hypothetical protein